MDFEIWWIKEGQGLMKSLNTHDLVKYAWGLGYSHGYPNDCGKALPGKVVFDKGAVVTLGIGNFTEFN